MLQTIHNDEPIVILKADPHEAELLRTHHADITAGYHMNKRHWITLHSQGSPKASEIKGLVTDSYELVVEKLTKNCKEDLLKKENS